jgi:hypothetical protein
MTALWVLSALGSPWPLAAAASAPPPAEPKRTDQPSVSGSIIQDKNFYLLTVFETDSVARGRLQSDAVLSEALKARLERIKAARETCKGEVACLLSPFLWSEAEIQAVNDRILAVLRPNGALTALVQRRLRPSGRFQRYAGLSDEGLLQQAWRDAAEGMNHILKVWGLGEPPLYPLIDSISYAPGDKMWSDGVGDMVDVYLAAPEAQRALVFQPSLQAALDVLYMNDRDEAARLEPLSLGENKAALAYAQTINWRAFPYPAMLIPGRSPTLKDNPLSPEAKMKLRLAARRFKAGLAPLIITSGGFVSPSQTRYCEACEMKRELMRAYGIPARAILIDPYARHTTTNLRNAFRLLFEAGAPLDRPILVTTTDYQSRYIEAPVFQQRCLRELGYACYSDLKRVSMFDTRLNLPLLSLHRDARDPLDP